ncbi:MAG: rhomboid family intramembrane serine protease [Oleiphilaceae bacterium]|nr:rhomboid family intramembrane serine protease [Oleiphilaceae bacterium]
MDEQEYQQQLMGSGPIPVINTLLVVNVVAFMLLLTAPYTGMQHFALWPILPEGSIPTPSGIPPGEFHIWQLLTYAFLHGGLLHLFINMFVLWMFGGPIERVWGSKIFAVYYLFCVIGAGAVQVTMTSIGFTPPAPSVGASGGVFAILLAFGLRFPNQYLLLLIPPIPIKAKYFVILLGVLELFAGVFGTQAGVANFAHLAGMAFGLIFILTVRPDARGR